MILIYSDHAGYSTTGSNLGVIDYDKIISKIDRLGGVDIGIKFGTKVQIPEEEYRRIFKDMFVNLGLSAEKVDEFEYIADLW
ncbi:MAG: hypothetical protein K8R25_16205 [Methanosarcinales archaeon]|nr:hypothetical protein [Methanosarcinales archaeon]